MSCSAAVNFDMRTVNMCYERQISGVRLHRCCCLTHLGREDMFIGSLLVAVVMRSTRVDSPTQRAMSQVVGHHCGQEQIRPERPRPSRNVSAQQPMGNIRMFMWIGPRTLDGQTMASPTIPVCAAAAQYLHLAGRT